MQIFSKGKKEKWMAARSINRSSEMATKQGKVNIRDRYKLVYDKINFLLHKVYDYDSL